MATHYNDLEFLLVENIRGIDSLPSSCTCKTVYTVVYSSVRGSNVSFSILSIQPWFLPLHHCMASKQK